MKNQATKNPALKMLGISLLVVGLILGCIFLSCILGSADLSIKDVCQILYQKLAGMEIEQEYKTTASIVWDLRFPRTIAALIVGGGLAVVGAAMQSITKNVMADPYTLGVSSGALAMVSIGTTVGGMFSMSSMHVSMLAFLGAMLSIVLVFAVGGVGKSSNTTRLILAGMAVSITLNAVSQFFIVTADNDVKVRGILSWMMGSFANIRWNNLLIPSVGIFLGCIYFMLHSRAFDLMALGDETAISLGTNVRTIKKVSLPVIAFVSGLAVAAGGLIGLVGFIIPHIVRFLIGTDHRRLFPLSFLVGGLFMLVMDIIARVVLSPQEVPIGIFTALCGGPFFVWLLRKKYREAS